MLQLLFSEITSTAVPNGEETEKIYETNRETECKVIIG